jgi:hypothetical protein
MRRTSDLANRQAIGLRKRAFQIKPGPTFLPTSSSRQKIGKPLLLKPYRVAFDERYVRD